MSEGNALELECRELLTRKIESAVSDDFGIAILGRGRRGYHAVVQLQQLWSNCRAVKSGDEVAQILEGRTSHPSRCLHGWSELSMNEFAYDQV